MGNVSINVVSHRRKYGLNDNDNRAYKTNIVRILDRMFADYDGKHLDIDVYNLDGDRHHHKAGARESRIVIYGNATDKSVESSQDYILDEPKTIGRIENQYKQFLGISGKGTVISSEHGVPLAEWLEDTWELNILFPVCNDYTESNIKILTFILEEVNRLVWSKYEDKKSWIKTDDRSRLVSSITNKMKENAEQELREARRKVNVLTEEIEECKRRIGRYVIDLNRSMRMIDSEDSYTDEVIAKVLKEFEDICNLDKVKDIIIEPSGEIKILTELLYIYDNYGVKYLGGEYQINIKMDNTSIRFFNKTNKRRGYWSEKDNHPHVAESGNPCFGTLSSTVAELCSQKELYALVTVCIDFLESANKEDCAGARVVNWDRVKEDGTVLESESLNKVRCPECGNDVDELITAYTDTDDDGDPCDEVDLCNSCLDENFHFDDELQVYMIG